MSKKLVSAHTFLTEIKVGVKIEKLDVFRNHKNFPNLKNQKRINDYSCELVGKIMEKKKEENEKLMELTDLPPKLQNFFRKRIIEHHKSGSNKLSVFFPVKEKDKIVHKEIFQSTYQDEETDKNLVTEHMDIFIDLDPEGKGTKNFELEGITDHIEFVSQRSQDHSPSQTLGSIGKVIDDEQKRIDAIFKKVNYLPDSSDGTVDSLGSPEESDHALNSPSISPNFERSTRNEQKIKDLQKDNQMLREKMDAIMKKMEMEQKLREVLSNEVQVSKSIKELDLLKQEEKIKQIKKEIKKVVNEEEKSTSKVMEMQESQKHEIKELKKIINELQVNHCNLQEDCNKIKEKYKKVRKVVEEQYKELKKTKKNVNELMKKLKQSETLLYEKEKQLVSKEKELKNLKLKDNELKAKEKNVLFQKKTKELKDRITRLNIAKELIKDDFEKKFGEKLSTHLNQSSSF